MSQNNAFSNETKIGTKNSPTAGIILVGIGLGLLIFQVTNLAMYFPLVLGATFLAAGMLTRKAGLLIPGGIIGGVGLGAVAVDSDWFFPTGAVETGGVILVAMALGWFSITVLSKIFTSETQTWALIPGAIMAFIGGLILMGSNGLRILEIAGKYWPAILVLIGLAILFNWWKERK